jgi:hypothetical protein
LTLSEKQQLFTLKIARLIQFADSMGYGLTFGEAYRSPEEAARLAQAGKGIKNSLHTERLAVDFNAFKDGVYLSGSESYRELGEFWESLSAPDVTCCWGGRFGDGDHFSIAHGGRK